MSDGNQTLPAHVRLWTRLKPGSQYDAEADVDAGIEMNPMPATASTSKDAACIKAVFLMLTLN